MEKVGKCEVCTINLWKECNNRPSVWPCGVTGCPYETPEEQLYIEYERSSIGNALAQALEEMS